jgi:hypothetical protein
MRLHVLPFVYDRPFTQDKVFGKKQKAEDSKYQDLLSFPNYFPVSINPERFKFAL